MTFRETVSVYCENHTEHTNTLWVENSVLTSQETHYVSDTKPNQLMLFRETLAVYRENHTEHTNTLWAENSVCTSQETLRLRYKAKPVNVV
jgi:hypothetical protein